MGVRLTDKIVSGLPAPAHGNRITYDAPDRQGRDWTPGFGVRVTAAGGRSFIFNFRTEVGRERRLTIGSPPAWSVEAARKEAASLRYRVDRGEDPLGIAQAGREAATVAGLIERFLDEHVGKLRPSTQAEYRALAHEIKKSIGTLKVAAVEYADIERLHRIITKRAPYRANRMLAVLSRMMSLAVKWKMRPDNPARGIERNAEAKRKRYLDVEGGELDRLVRALAAHEDQQIANIFRLLLLTGARRGEVLSATWDQFELGRGLWTKPAHATKQRAEHQVPLSKAALELLKAMRKTAPDDTTFLFPARPGSAGGHRATITKSWYAIIERAGIKDFRIHDLRHSYASVLVSAGHSLPTIGALLGHTQVATTARYSHLFDDVQRAATNKVGAVMAGLVAKPSKRRPLKVVEGGKR